MENLTLPDPDVVRELPLSVTSEQQYSFARLARTDVTMGTHGLHKYPAKFIPQIPRWALQYDNRTPARRILDPFCGSGTTLVEAGLRGADAVGVDISPLAIAISRAKCSRINLSDDSLDRTVDTLLAQAKGYLRQYTKEFESARGASCRGMHFTWANWFEPHAIAGLVAIRDAIANTDEIEDVKDLALATLSSVTKACSYLNEDQIKVRFDGEKNLAEPFRAFRDAFLSASAAQREVGRKFDASRASLETHLGSASAVPLEAGCFDRVITSPPYINAVDYTMAHKYNLFVLGLLPPDEFKAHCRDYIGITERAVRSEDMARMPLCPTTSVQSVVSSLQALDTPTSRNRAYVVAQYFDGMASALAEGYRLLDDGGLYFLVVGESNRICNLLVPTADLLEEIANEIGFETELRFFHVLANRSSMRLNRSSTGGSIARERIYVFRK